MTVRLLTKHHLEFLSLKKATQARLSLFMSKCHIVGKHVLRIMIVSRDNITPHIRLFVVSPLHTDR